MLLKVASRAGLRTLGARGAIIARKSNDSTKLYPRRNPHPSTKTYLQHPYFIFFAPHSFRFVHLTQAPAAAAPASSGGGLFGAAAPASGAATTTPAATPAATNPAAGAATVAQAKAVAVEHRKVEELLRNWEERITAQSTQFARFADQVLQVDTSIIANAGKLRDLSQDTAALRVKQETVDQSIKQLYEQQDSLANLLQGIQDALAARGPPGSREGTATHSKAVMLATQLDEMDKQIETLTKETSTVQEQFYSSPLSTVVQILNHHGNSLDAIEGQADALTKRIGTIEKTLTL